MEKRRIAILGSTGSIGKQTLDVIRQHRDLFEVELLTANNSSDLLITQAIEFDCNTVVICNENKYKEVSEALQKYDIKVFAGIKSVCDLLSGDNIDIVVAAMVGFSGLAPAIEAVKAGKAIALANKETLVAAGSIIMDLALKYHSPILPVDSEHSAIFQCLLGAGNNKISKIHLTASGGPFRTMDRPEIAKATKDMALKHPNWNMGAKITIDSATMMNKGFEMIEAKWLFDVAPENINIVVHPESIIHSMIEYEDGAIIAQMGHPDMRESIQFAINFPNRLPLNNKKINFSELGKLSFFAPDNEKFPALGLSFKAIAKGGNIPCALNAANEAAVAAFLKDKIHFYDISDIVEKCINDITYIEKPTIEEIFETHNNTLALADKLIDKK
ncbi:MAG: 1-deoxy-D-xylulose-5-phosphate reductoisomerase [Candidatus Cryptobacteroides sp.]